MTEKFATYTMADGSKRTVYYDASAPCRICGLPVIEASMGGADVCPWCDMGVHRDGRKWTYRETLRFSGNIG